jgi:hypothetical protein
VLVEVLQSIEILLVAGQKELWLLKQEKQNCIICRAQAVLSQLLVLKCCKMVMPLFTRIDTSQPNSWHTVCQ